MLVVGVGVGCVGVDTVLADQVGQGGVVFVVMVVVVVVRIAVVVMIVVRVVRSVFRVFVVVAVPMVVVIQCVPSGVGVVGRRSRPRLAVVARRAPGTFGGLRRGRHGGRRDVGVVVGMPVPVRVGMAIGSAVRVLVGVRLELANRHQYPHGGKAHGEAP